MTTISTSQSFRDKFVQSHAACAANAVCVSLNAHKAEVVEFIDAWFASYTMSKDAGSICFYFETPGMTLLFLRLTLLLNRNLKNSQTEMETSSLKPYWQF